MRIKFEIKQEPVAKGRPRHGAGRVYTPAKTRLFENTVAVEYQKRFTGLTLVGPIRLQVMLGYEPPKSLSALKRAALIGTLRDRKPDIDNLVKSIMDGLQKGGAFHDDGQVAVLEVCKYYAGGYSIEIELEEMGRETVVDLGGCEYGETIE